MNLDLVLEFTPVGESNDDDFEAFLDRAIEELDNLDRDDIDVSAALADHRATFTVFDVDWEQPDIDKFLSAIRTALHAAGCATPGWDNHAMWEVEDRELTLA
jgi:hypothetical protein